MSASKKDNRQHAGKVKRHPTHRSYDVSDVGDRGTARGTEVEDLLARGDVDVVEATEDAGRKLASERVPDSVLDLGLCLASVGSGRLDADPLLAVDRLAWNDVAGDEEVLLALCDKDAGVSVWLDENLGGTTCGREGGEDLSQK